MPNEVEIRITANDLTGPAFASALAKLEALKAAAKDAGGTVFNVDNSGLSSALSALKSKMQSMGIADIADVNVQPGVITQRLQLLKRLLNQSGISDLLDVNVNDAAALRQISKISSMTETVPINFSVNDAGLSRGLGQNMGLTESELANLSTARLGFKDLGLSVSEAAAAMKILDMSTMHADASLEIAWQQAIAFSKAIDNAHYDANLMNAAMQTYNLWLIKTAQNSDNAAKGSFDTASGFSLVAGSANRAWGWLSPLTAKMTLLGPLMGRDIPLMSSLAYGGLHLLADGFIELAAVIIPAAVGLATFGVGAAPTIQAVYQQMSNMNTVASALGVSMPGLKSGVQNFDDAFKPQALQLFGDALQIANSRGGVFRQMAVDSGNAVDKLATRLTLAITNGNGFSKFAHDAGPDVYKLGTLVGNLGGILGVVFQEVPGYAQILLNLANGFTHVAEEATIVAKPLIGFGIAAHGAMLYTAVLGTIAGKIIPPAFALVGNTAARAATMVESIGPAGAVAAAGLDKVTGVAAEAGALPWGWITVAAVGLGFLAYEMIQQKDATQQWFAAQETAISGAKTLSSGYGLIQSTLAQTQDRLKSSTSQLSSVQRQNSGVVAQTRGSYMANVATELQLQAVNQELSRDQQKLNSQAIGYSTNLGKLAIQYGGVGKAVALATLAGVSMNDMMDKTKWPTIISEVMATAAAYNEMGIQGGQLGTDLNAVNIASSSQITDMGKLNSAWDTTIGIVSGGQTSFISFEQALQAIGPSAAAAGASMNGLNANSLTLRSNFQAAYSQASTLADALRMMSSASPGSFPSVAGAIGDVIAQLIPYGKLSTATQAEIVALAQENNGQITSWNGVIQAYGNIQNPGKKLNSLLAGMGINIQDLTTDASALSTTMGQAFTSMAANAKLSSVGMQNAISKAANDYATNSGNIQKDLLGIYNKLLTAGYGAKTALAMVDSLGFGLLHLPKTTPTKVTTDGSQASAEIDFIRNKMNQIKGMTVSTYITTWDTIVQNVIQSALNPPGLTGPKAGGGVVSYFGAAGGGVRNGMTLVGEHGIELAQLPAGTTVHSNPDTLRMLGEGGGQPVQIIMSYDGSVKRGLSASDLEKIRFTVVTKGGGDVQKAFGRNGA